MNGRTSASAKAGVQDWVDSNFIDVDLDDVPKRQSIQDSSFDLRSGCDVKEIGEDDTIPAELLSFFQ